MNDVIATLNAWLGGRVQLRLRSATTPTQHVWFGELTHDALARLDSLEGWYLDVKPASGDAGRVGNIELFLNAYLACELVAYPSAAQDPRGHAITAQTLAGDHLLLEITEVSP